MGGGGNASEAESYAPKPLRVIRNPRRHNRNVVEVSSSKHDGSIVNLASTEDVQSMRSKEEE